MDRDGAAVPSARRVVWSFVRTASQVPSSVLEFLFGFMFIPQALLPLVALLYASGMIQDELEEQTITYLLIRPIPRWALYLTKLLATLTTTVVLTSIFTALTYAAVYVGTDAHGENIRSLRQGGCHPQPRGRLLLLPVRADDAADATRPGDGHFVHGVF
jgi:hypothetical protein